MTCSFLELLIFFWLTPVDIYPVNNRIFTKIFTIFTEQYLPKLTIKIPEQGVKYVQS